MPVSLKYSVLYGQAVFRVKLRLDLNACTTTFCHGHTLLRWAYPFFDTWRRKAGLTVHYIKSFILQSIFFFFYDEFYSQSEDFKYISSKNIIHSRFLNVQSSKVCSHESFACGAYKLLFSWYTSSPSGRNAKCVIHTLARTQLQHSKFSFNREIPWKPSINNSEDL